MREILTWRELELLGWAKGRRRLQGREILIFVSFFFGQYYS
jgi:hypothetical protein